MQKTNCVPVTAILDLEAPRISPANVADTNLHRRILRVLPVTNVIQEKKMADEVDPGCAPVLQTDHRKVNSHLIDY